MDSYWLDLTKFLSRIPQITCYTSWRCGRVLSYSNKISFRNLVGSKFDQITYKKRVFCIIFDIHHLITTLYHCSVSLIFYDSHSLTRTFPTFFTVRNLTTITEFRSIGFCKHSCIIVMYDKQVFYLTKICRLKMSSQLYVYTLWVLLRLIGVQVNHAAVIAAHESCWPNNV